MLEHYEILDAFGEGGTASVQLARRHGADELCVLKTLHGHLASDGVAAARFLREAELASMLEHENIGRLLDAGRTGNLFYVALELIPGRDLRALNDKLWSGN